MREIAVLRHTHPDVRLIDVLLADLCGIPRGKRIALNEAPNLCD